MGRQGIYDAGGLVGYELLFGSVPVFGGTALTGDEMTAEVLFGAMSIGLDQLVGSRLVFCHGDRGVVTGEVPLVLPPERTVIEVPHAMRLDHRALAGCERLVGEGYRLALENFVWWDAAQAPLLDYAAIVKVDTAMAPESELTQVVELCRARGIRPLAMQVGQREDLARLADLGLELFQGYGLDRPNLVRGRTLAPTVASGIAAAAEVLGTEPHFDKLEAILRRDPALAFQIMQLASIGRMGEPRRTVSTIREAIVLAGTVQIRNWLALLMARPAGPRARAYDAFLATLLRARACELLVAEFDHTRSAIGFAAGMLSALDVLLEVPLDEVADTLSLSPELRDAAFGGEGPIARVVQDATRYQLHEPEAGADDVHREHLHAAFARAFPWAVESAAIATQPAEAAG